MEEIDLNAPLKFQALIHKKFMKHFDAHPEPLKVLAVKMKMRPEALNNFICNERLHSRTLDRIAAWLMEQGIE